MILQFIKADLLIKSTVKFKLSVWGYNHYGYITKNVIRETIGYHIFPYPIWLLVSFPEELLLFINVPSAYMNIYIIQCISGNSGTYSVTSLHITFTFIHPFFPWALLRKDSDVIKMRMIFRVFISCSFNKRYIKKRLKRLE